MFTEKEIEEIKNSCREISNEITLKTGKIASKRQVIDIWGFTYVFSKSNILNLRYVFIAFCFVSAVWATATAVIMKYTHEELKHAVIYAIVEMLFFCTYKAIVKWQHIKVRKMICRYKTALEESVGSLDGFVF